MLSDFLLTAFGAIRLRDDDIALYERYKEFLATPQLARLRMLILKAEQLLADESVAAPGSTPLVFGARRTNSGPEFPASTGSPCAGHRARQRVRRRRRRTSIYSWTGADPSVFRAFANDFKVGTEAQLGENWRCPRQVVDLARRSSPATLPFFTTEGRPRRATNLRSR